MLLAPSLVKAVNVLSTQEWTHCNAGVIIRKVLCTVINPVVRLNRNRFPKYLGIIYLPSFFYVQTVI